MLATARRADLLDELARECSERIEVMPGDITDASHRQAQAGQLASRGRLDVLVNNAGICDDGPIGEQSLDDLRQVIEVNLISVLDLCRLSAPLLLAAPAASVIHVASMYGIVASRGPMAAYNATKGTLVNLTPQLAAQWGGRGVAGQRPGPWLLPDRADRPAGRRWLRPVHPRAPRSPAPRPWKRSTARCCSWPPPPPAR